MFHSAFDFSNTYTEIAASTVRFLETYFNCARNLVGLELTEQTLNFCGIIFTEERLVAILVSGSPAKLETMDR